MEKEYKGLLDVDHFDYISACAFLLPNYIKICGPHEYVEVYKLSAETYMGGGFGIRYINRDYNSHKRNYKHFIDDDPIDCLKYMRKMLNDICIDEITKEEFEELKHLPKELLDPDNIFLHMSDEEKSTLYDVIIDETYTHRIS